MKKSFNNPIYNPIYLLAMPKTPISYYGGKLNMNQHIIPLIPEHKIYTEVFFGGGAVFFAKQPAPSEIINDTNIAVINFYKVCKTNFDVLKLKIESTLFSRATYHVALTIYKMPHLFNELQQAWAFYVATNMGFGCRIGSWGFDKYGKRVKAFHNKKLQFNEEVFNRLEKVQIENYDACKVLELYNAPDAFHYIDPPYIDSNQGHYEGYTREDYTKLLETCSCIKGRFLLSSYPSDLLEQYTKKFGWYTKSFRKPLTAKKGVGGQKRDSYKTEVLTANYPI